MKVYVVVEWTIDYFYEVWGVFTSREKAENFVKKLEELDKRASWGLDGELRIDEVELDDDSAYLVKCRWFDEDGKIIRQECMRITKDKDYYEHSGGLECWAVGGECDEGFD